MLDSWQVSGFYANARLGLPGFWNLSRKHVRVQTLDGRFVKLNRFENRLNPRELQEYCVTLQPSHVYFSILDWLFPERVGKKHKANNARPVGSGEYVVDVDAYVGHRFHPHHDASTVLPVCPVCLDVAKELTIQACTALELYYSDVHVVFSGRHGFHIHVRDFNIRDWTLVNYADLVKSHEAARFRFSKVISLQTFCFDRAHFILSVDPMRVITVPGTLNAETGLKCIYIGDRRTLEYRTIENILWQANTAGDRYGYPEPLRLGVMKPCA